MINCNYEYIVQLITIKNMLFDNPSFYKFCENLMLCQPE